MLDVHPPHASTHTWQDFFIHIATIVIGLLIAVGLEQLVEVVHHRHQRSELTRQLREEAQSNLPLAHESIARMEVQVGYIRALKQALLAGKIAGINIDVQGVPPAGGSSFYISPSRATWQSAQAAGIAALLPADQARLYARLDFEITGEIDSEREMHEKLQDLLDACAAAQYDHASAATQRISIAHRDEILARLERLDGILNSTIGYLCLVEGAEQAIVADARSLEDMYRYQQAARSRRRTRGDGGIFFGDPGLSK